jgi:hypothetical protein
VLPVRLQRWRQGFYPTQSFDIKTLLRDPWNHDFRACPGTVAGSKGAGAYRFVGRWPRPPIGQFDWAVPM